ncbi:MAG TPA: NIPSNAP family protein [Caulobacteraceae bacterium]|jgi:hypothetical protein|nr:NIPSNAP family protein [Caulobacteraceae bacterium]
MIYEVRTYTCKVGFVQRQLAFYREHGFEVQSRILGAPVLFGVTEVGELNTYIHIWAYESHADREARRAALMAEPAWRAYLQRSEEVDYLIGQATTLYNAFPMAPRAA